MAETFPSRQPEKAAVVERPVRYEAAPDHSRNIGLATDKHTVDRDLKAAKEAATVASPPPPQVAAPLHRRAPNARQRDATFSKQMRELQQELPPSKRIVSHIIHLRPVEATSALLERSLARPRALLYGSAAAFIAVTGSFFLSRHYGYELSGFELIVAFAGGWVVGFIGDQTASLRRKN